MPILVHSLGDSTLDNIIWVMGRNSTPQEDKENCAEGQLDQVLNPIGHPRRFEVISHAFDGFTTRSLLEGDRVGRVLHGNYAYNRYMTAKSPASDSELTYPLDTLREEFQKDPDGIHYVVLSVGGNDFRENLFNPWRFLKDIPQIQSRYLQVVEKIKGLDNKNVRLILAFQYQTDTNNDIYGVYQILGYIGRIAATVHSVCVALLVVSTAALLAGVVRTPAAAAIGGVSLLVAAAVHYLIPINVSIQVIRGTKDAGVAAIGALMKRFYAPILLQAEKDRIPILDLPNTFNPFDGSLYLSGIEPSKKGGRLIAEGIAHIIGNHDFGGKSRIYAKSASSLSYSGDDLNGGTSWTVRYPES